MSENLKPLTAEEEALPYSKYYYRTPATPNPKPLAELNKGPMDPAKALPLESINDILDPGYHEVENGYCTMDNGIGYVAVNNVFPGVTLDMMKWWFVWHAAGPGLRYKIWYPPGHRGISVSDGDRAKLLDNSLSIEERYKHVDHYVIEDVGGGDEDIVISFLSPETMGFDVEKLKGSPTKEIFGGYGITESRSRPGQKQPAVMMHTAREIDGGIEFRTRFYMGARIVGGKPKCVLPHGVRVPDFVPKGLAYHNVEEYSNLAAILPELYKEFGPAIQ